MYVLHTQLKQGEGEGSVASTRGEGARAGQTARGREVSLGILKFYKITIIHFEFIIIVF